MPSESELKHIERTHAKYLAGQEAKAGLMGCPKCGATDKLQRSNTVHVWETGTLDASGEFHYDDRDLEIDWESQNPENRYYCRGCFIVFTVDADDRAVEVVIE